MDDKPLHDLLEGTLAGEPPIGPLGQNSLAAGIRLRRRRRIRAAAATAAAAVIALAIPAGLGAFGHLLKPARPQQPPAPPTLYIYGADLHVRHHRGQVQDTVTPVGMATNTPGKPIHISGAGMSVGQIVITPDGKTAYVNTGSIVTPISTATGTPGKPIHVRGGFAPGIAITPDGKTAYVADWSGPAGQGRTVTPISTATNTPGKPIKVGYGTGQIVNGVGQIAVTPDGKTAYAITGTSVTPISTATNTPGKPIHTGTPNMPGTDHIVITPDGKTAYVMTGSGVTPISTATNRAGTTIHVGQGDLAQIAITPDGKTVYVSTVFGCHDRPSNEYCTFAVTPITTATNMPGTPITVGSGPWTLYDVGQIAITPDGKTAYVTTGTSVTPISTATNTPGKPIHLGKVNIPGGGGPGGQIVITPDGKTAYVTTGSGVTPISTATNTPGKPIHVVGTIAIAITP